MVMMLSLFYSLIALLQAPLRHQNILSRYQVPINTSHQSLSHICDETCRYRERDYPPTQQKGSIIITIIN